MTTSEKVAYLKGLCEGMDIGESTKEGKVLKVIADILEDLSLEVNDVQDSVEDLADCVDEVVENMTCLEEELDSMLCDGDCDECDMCDECGGCFSDEDEDDEDDEDEDPVFYSVECPECGFRLAISEDIVDQGSFECPECGKEIDLTTADLEEVDFDEDEEEEED